LGHVGLFVLFAVVAPIALGAVMWVWTVDHLTHDLDLERHGIRVSATVIADGGDPKNPSEQLSFPLPDGGSTTQWSSAVSSQQAPGSAVAVVYLSGYPSTVESTDYLRWWWIGGTVMPAFGTVFILTGLWLLRFLVRTLRHGSPEGHMAGSTL
jgi:hypothetical protein